MGLSGIGYPDNKSSNATSGIIFTALNALMQSSRDLPDIDISSVTELSYSAVNAGGAYAWAAG